MSGARIRLAVSLPPVACALVVACTGRPPTPAFAIDGGGLDDGGDAGGPPLADSSLGDSSAGRRDAEPPPTDDGSLEAAGPAALLRAANWSPDSPAAGYDFCLAPHGTSAWQGPEVAATLGGVGTLGDAGTNAMQFPVVTNYLFFVPPGAYDVAIVASGEGCNGPVTVTKDLAALTTGGFYTLAIVGDAVPSANDPALTAVLLIDDSLSPGGSANIRFLNLAPSARSVDFGKGDLSSGTFVPLATGVTFGVAPGNANAEAGALDPNGYASIPAESSSITFSAHVAGVATDLVTTAPLTPMPGNVDTMALVGGKTGGRAPVLLMCTEDGVQNQSSGLVASCATVSM